MLPNQPPQNSPVPPPQQSPGGAPPMTAQPVPQHFQQAGIQQHPDPSQMGPSPFDRAIPGQSLTDTPKNSAWEHSPKYTSMHDALNYIFDQIIKPVNLKQSLTLLQKGISIEDLARMILFTGFSTGHWTPDLAMMLAKPVVHILAGIAHRAGLKDAKLTREDRSGFKNLYKMQQMPNLTSQTPVPTPTPTKKQLQGFMSPPKGI